MPIWADTDRLMDRCPDCGGFPGVEKGRQDGDVVYRARCTDCCNIASWAFSIYDTAVAWNLEQRAKKRGK